MKKLNIKYIIVLLVGMAMGIVMSSNMYIISKYKNVSMAFDNANIPEYNLSFESTQVCKFNILGNQFCVELNGGTNGN